MNISAQSAQNGVKYQIGYMRFPLEYETSSNKPGCARKSQKIKYRKMKIWEVGTSESQNNVVPANATGTDQINYGC